MSSENFLLAKENPSRELNPPGRLSWLVVLLQDVKARSKKNNKFKKGARAIDLAVLNLSWKGGLDENSRLVSPRSSLILQTLNSASFDRTLKEGRAVRLRRKRR